MICVGPDFRFGLPGRGRSLNIEVMELENRLESQEDRELVIYQQNASFHG